MCVRAFVDPTTSTAAIRTRAKWIEQKGKYSTQRIRIKTLFILIVLNAFACNSALLCRTLNAGVFLCFFHFILSLIAREKLEWWPMKVGINRSNSHSMEPTTRTHTTDVGCVLEICQFGHFTFQLKPSSLKRKLVFYRNFKTCTPFAFFLLFGFNTVELDFVRPIWLSSDSVFCFVCVSLKLAFINRKKGFGFSWTNSLHNQKIGYKRTFHHTVANQNQGDPSKLSDKMNLFIVVYKKTTCVRLYTHIDFHQESEMVNCLHSPLLSSIESVFFLN